MAGKVQRSSSQRLRYGGGIARENSGVRRRVAESRGPQPPVTLIGWRSKLQPFNHTP